jgi:lipooligosaccharide transport system ATP-binding protein
MTYLVARELRKSYGTHEVVAGIDLELKPGECFGLLGPNGAGKTTTLRLCLGLTDPDGGTISMFDLPIPRSAREARARVGVVPQIDNLDPDFTVRENLMVYGRYFGLSKSHIDARIPALLEFAGLANRAGDSIKALSGGMKRRLTLARALINDPDLIFLDEPTTGLDPQSRRQLWEVLERFRGNGGTVLITTHYMDEAHELCDRVGIMDQGRLIALGTPRELVASLGAEHVVEFALTDGPPIEDHLFSALPGVRDVRRDAGELHLSTSELHLTVPALLDFLSRNHAALSRLGTHSATLEDVFVTLTGRQLRDE